MNIERNNHKKTSKKRKQIPPIVTRTTQEPGAHTQGHQQYCTEVYSDLEEFLWQHKPPSKSHKQIISAWFIPGRVTKAAQAVTGQTKDKDTNFGQYQN